MLGQFSRYIGVQLVAYAIDMGVFLALANGAGLPPLTANVGAKLAAGAFAFVVHRRVTFRTHGQGGTFAQLGKYALLLAANVPLSSLLLWALLPWVASAVLAKFLADAACVLLTFGLSRHVVFGAPRGGQGKAA